MATSETLRTMTVMPWMAGSHKPEMKDWLSQDQTAEDKERLKAIGNVVVPRMGYLALQILAEIWNP